MSGAHNGNAKALLLQALESIWAREDSVERFGLELLRERIRPMYGGWIVPVATGITGENANDLVRALRRIEDETEDRTHLSVSITLDPGFSD